MHRYRTIAQISLILSILNLVLAAPIGEQEIHRVPGGETAAAEGVAAMPTASDRPTSPGSSPDAMASPQHMSLPDGLSSSGYRAPYLSSDESVSDYSWWLDRPPRLNQDLLASLQGSAPPHPPSLRSSWMLHRWLQELAPVAPELAPVAPEMPPSPQLSEWDYDYAATTDTYNPQDNFTPLHHPSSLLSTDPPGTWFNWGHSVGSTSTPYLSALDGSPSSHYLTASEGSVPSHHSMSEGLAPSTHLTSDGSPPPETPPDNAEFFNKNMMKKIKIVAGMLIVGGIAGIVVSQIKHHNKHRDYQDS